MMKLSVTARAALAAVALGAVAAVPASAQITKSGAGYLFRMKFTKGMKLPYQMVSLTPEPINSFDPKRVEGPFTMTILDVVNGIATVRVDSGPFSLDGKSINKTNTAQVKMNDRGKIVEGAAGAAQMNGGIVLPDKPLKAGESFEATTSIPVQGRTMTIKSRVTFAGIKSVRGKQVAEMKVTVSGTGLLPTLGTGTQLLDLADGQLLSARIDQQAKAKKNGKDVVVKNEIRVYRK